MHLEALIAYLVDRMEIRGKKALQKLVYFCTEAGVPVYARYRMYIYGPYSNEVAEELGETIVKEIVKVEGDGTGFSRGLSCKEYLDRHRQDIEVNRDKVERVLQTFGSFSPLQLELYATVHFIASALREAYGEVTEDKVVSEVMVAKGDKFAEPNVRQAYQNLLGRDWLPNA